MNKVSNKGKKIYRHVSFGWEPTWDGMKHLIDILKSLGFIVYDMSSKDSQGVDYVITNKPIKRHKGKEL